jgi:RNA polymerase sigma-70 factor, ECF subfamily
VVLSDLDRSLLDRCLGGAAGAWEDLVDRYLPLIIHTVNSTGRLKFEKLPDQWRDDIVAEVLLALIDKEFEVLRQFQGQSSLGTYLVVVARRVAARKISKMRRLHSDVLLAASQGEVRSAAADSNQAEEFFFQHAEQVAAMLEKLPEAEAKVVRMFHLEHCSYAEISSHLGIPENSIGPLLSRARSRLRSMDSTQ